MGFFAEELADGSGVSIPVPDGYELHLCHVCIDPDEPHGNRVVFRVRTANDEREYNVCVLSPQANVFHATLSLVFGKEDEPVEFGAEGGTLHLTGKWTWDDSGDDEGCEDACGDGEGSEDEDGSENEDGEEDAVDEEEDEPPKLIPIPGNKAKSSDKPQAGSNGSKDSKKRKADAVEATPIVAQKSSSQPVKPQAEKKQPAPESLSAPEPASNKRQKVAPVATEQPAEPARSNKKLKAWKVHPFEEEGIEVPEPKAVIRKDGLVLTDYVIGKGAVPKAGGVVEILYEGLFPESGSVFDKCVKRKQPFSFRKGLQQVIPGLDRGIEGMRVGGAREIAIPSALGYGAKKVGSIPKNSDLVFRVQLLAAY